MTQKQKWFAAGGLSFGILLITALSLSGKGSFSGGDGNSAENLKAAVLITPDETVPLVDIPQGKPTATTVPTSVSAYEVPTEQRETLNEYNRVQKKVFMWDREKEARNLLLQNRDFLFGLEPLLKSVKSKDIDFQILQNSAIDLLLEADMKYQSEAARQVLMNIVKDNQVENSSLPVAERKALAGVKAEVLYLWTAQNPNISYEVPSQLPGPVSQKIWQNVLTTQDKNLQESLAEAN